MKISKKGTALPNVLAEYAKNMTSDDANELRVLIYILSVEDEIDSSEIEKELGITETEVVSAVSFWRGTGLVDIQGKAKRKSKENKTDTKERLPNSLRDTETRTYTGEEIEALISEKPELSMLVNFTQERLGKMLNMSEISKLIYLQEYILLTYPMIVRIIDYCADNNKKSMRYVEKVAISLYDNGISSYDALENYLNNLENQKSYENVVKKVIGAENRNFTQREKKCIMRWSEEFSYGREMVELAYEKTIANIAKPSVEYMSKVLEAWHTKGYKNCEDVRLALENKENEKKPDISLEMFDEGRNIKEKKPSMLTNEEKEKMNLEDFFEN